MANTSFLIPTAAFNDPHKEGKRDKDGHTDSKSMFISGCIKKNTHAFEFKLVAPLLGYRRYEMKELL